MDLVEKIKSNPKFRMILKIALGLLFLQASPGIVTAIFDVGRNLGKAIGMAIWG